MNHSLANDTIQTESTSGLKSARMVNSSLIKTSLFSSCISLILIGGFVVREEYFWNAEEGLGYWLGVVGASCMLLLLIYPLRKRYAMFSRSMTVSRWFKLHMALGIIGPTLILLHCNFSYGSFNSNIALISMLLMVSSGLVGRFIYSKIHRGLYGKRLSLTQLKSDKQNLLNDINKHIPNTQIADDIVNILCQFEIHVSRPASIAGNIYRILTLSIKTRNQHRVINKKISTLRQLLIEKSATDKKLDMQHERNLNSLKTMTRRYLGLVRQTAELGFYERLFSLWHLLHLPIFGLLIIAASLHVYAVHNY